MQAMQPGATRQQYPELKQLVLEASQALARLDSVRLEELALSCKALNRDLNRNSDTDPHGEASRAKETSSAEEALSPEHAWSTKIARRARLAAQAGEAQGEMAIFARVLDSTRSNLSVLNRLRDLRSGRLEYSVSSPAAALGWPKTERGQPRRRQLEPGQMERAHGDN